MSIPNAQRAENNQIRILISCFLSETISDTFCNMVIMHPFTKGDISLSLALENVGLITCR